MSRRNSRILTIQENEELKYVLSLLGVERETISPQFQIALYEMFCKAPLRHFTELDLLEDRTLLLQRLMLATFQPDYMKAAQKKPMMLLSTLVHMQSWLNSVVTQLKSGATK